MDVVLARGLHQNDGIDGLGHYYLICALAFSRRALMRTLSSYTVGKVGQHALILKFEACGHERRTVHPH